MVAPRGQASASWSAEGGAGRPGPRGSSSSSRPRASCCSCSAPLTLPVALGCFAHAWLIPWLQARRGRARSGAGRGARHRAGGDPEAEPGGARAARRPARPRGARTARRDGSCAGTRRARRVAGGRARSADGPARRAPGGQLVREGGRARRPARPRTGSRICCLALREDEAGFAKVANLGFSGAPWRVRRGLHRALPLRRSRGRAANGADVSAARSAARALVPIDEV